MAAGCAYLALSVFMWWHVWSGHPTSTTLCGCGDPSLFTSFIEWPAHAIPRGLSPFYSTAVNAPSGINLLANTSVLTIGVVLAPVTWIFGPVATLNVASTLAPALSAMAMFVLLRRWVSWAPAAFVGGLFYGFSPFIVVALSWAHLMLGLAAVPPLVLICLDELLVRQRRRPVLIGSALGLLIALQFFIGSELLLIMAIVGAVGLLLVAAYAAWRQPDAFRERVHHAMVGLSTGAGTALVLLAYPVWFAVAGPDHFAGPVWPATGGSNGVATSTTLLRRYLFPAPGDSGAAHLDHMMGGYQGPILSDQYFGIGVVVVLIVGIIVWRRDRRLWLFGAIGIVSVVLSSGVNSVVWTPWRLLANLPLFEDIYPYRIVFVTYLAVAVMLGLIVDHTYWAVSRAGETMHDRTAGRAAGSLRPRLPAWSGAAAGAVVAAIALVPPAAYLAQTMPVTTRPVALPLWFRTVAPHLADHQVLLVLPARTGTSTNNDNPMTWQAVDAMRFAMVGAGGPSGILQRTGEERRGAAVIAAASAPPGVNEAVGPGDVPAVSRALRQWGVTMVVIPDQTDLPVYDQISSVTFAAALITASTGRRPIHKEDAWVWRGVASDPPAAFRSDARISACTHGTAVRGVTAVDAATNCVLHTTSG